MRDKMLMPYKTVMLSNNMHDQFFLNQHSTKEGTWGRLTWLSGDLAVAFLDNNGRVLTTHPLNENNPTVTLAPATLHRLMTHDKPYELTIDFCCLPHRYFVKKYQLGNVQSDILYAFKTYLNELKPGNLLDVGCGTGRNALYIALQGHSVTGIDKNTERFTKIQSIAETENVSVATQGVDLNQTTNLQANYFNVVISTVTLQFLNPSRIPDLLDELIDATASNGYHLLVFPIEQPPFVFPENFTYLAKEKQLYYFYQNRGWSIIEYKESMGRLHRNDSEGKPMQGLFGFLLAQKIGH